jgi:hypothetical protein
MITVRAIEIRVCFKDKLKNAYITVATDDVSKPEESPESGEKRRKASR